ncbi:MULTISPECIES: hypothetical protein [Pseudomonas]|uniref:hypothetical protein n=1 Tax=Pseudomonas TaxID=286 RepID=UPI0012DF41AD|nr:MULTISPECIES: hypothetical protein [unclassified Pseudomonas]
MYSIKTNDMVGPKAATESNHPHHSAPRPGPVYPSPGECSDALAPSGPYQAYP